MVKAPETEAEPPVVNRPVPVVTGPLPVVFRFMVPVPADKVRFWLPEVARVAAEPLPKVEVVPWTARLPARVVRPVLSMVRPLVQVFKPLLYWRVSGP